VVIAPKVTLDSLLHASVRGRLASGEVTAIRRIGAVVEEAGGWETAESVQDKKERRGGGRTAGRGGRPGHLVSRWPI